MKCVAYVQLFSVGMFRVDPRERPNINDVVERLQEIAAARNVNLKDPLPHSLLSQSIPQQSGKYNFS